MKSFPGLRNVPPKIIAQGEYWPNGPGAEHLERWNRGERQKRVDKQRKPTRRNTVTDVSGFDALNNGTKSAEQLWSVESLELAKRSDGEPTELLEPGDEEYPLPYSIDDMVDFYGNIE